MTVVTGVRHPVVTREQLLEEIARVLRIPVTDIPDREDLMLLGFGSLQLMRLVNKFRCRGIPVTYADMAAKPTVDSWWTRLAKLQSAIV